MNIIDAVKSGKKFRRPGWQNWHDDKYHYAYSAEELLANDWQIDLSITISKYQFYDAFDDLYYPAPEVVMVNGTKMASAKRIAIMLGLETT